MKSTRQYTCTRRMNKTGDKIWVVIEKDKLFYRIFKTQTAAITYFKQLKTPAQMTVQQATGDKFSKVVFTIEEMARKGLKNSSKVIPPKLVKDSDKFFDEKELKEKDEPKKPEPKKPKTKKVEAKKAEAKKAEVKKAEAKKAEPKKPEVKKAEVKKAKPKQKAKAKPSETKTDKVLVKKVAKAVALPKAKEKVEEKPKPITKPKKVSKPKPIEKETPPVKNVYIEKIIKVDSNTGEIITDDEFENLLKVKQSTKTMNLMSELEKLDEARIEEFEKQDTLNLSIIDEILQRKSMVENSWNEDFNNSDNLNLKNSIENTIYVKEEIEKPIIINSQKINFNEDSNKATSTIENIIDQRSEEANIKSVDYGRIKEYTDHEKTQIQNFNNETLENADDLSTNSKKTKNKKSMDPNAKNSGKNARFWVITILLSLLIMVAVTAIILWFLPSLLPTK